jgi:hypothetical protein
MNLLVTISLSLLNEDAVMSKENGAFLWCVFYSMLYGKELASGVLA